MSEDLRAVNAHLAEEKDHRPKLSVEDRLARIERRLFLHVPHCETCWRIKTPQDEKNICPHCDTVFHPGVNPKSPDEFAAPSVLPPIVHPAMEKKVLHAFGRCWDCGKRLENQSRCTNENCSKKEKKDEKPERSSR